MNTANDFLFGGDHEQVSPLIPVKIVSRDQAFRTAAWIEFMAQTLPDEVEGEHPTYDEVKEAVRGT